MDVLTFRERFVYDLRKEGYTLEQISRVYALASRVMLEKQNTFTIRQIMEDGRSCSTERVRQTLIRAQRKLTS